jgi:hypothetical protein
MKSRIIVAIIIAICFTGLGIAHTTYGVDGMARRWVAALSSGADSQAIFVVAQRCCAPP